MKINGWIVRIPGTAMSDKVSIDFFVKKRAALRMWKAGALRSATLIVPEPKKREKRS